MTILALRGMTGAGEGEAFPLLERALERERERDCASSSRMGVRDRPRETLRSACGEDIVGLVGEMEVISMPLMFAGWMDCEHWIRRGWLHAQKLW